MTQTLERTERIERTNRTLAIFCFLTQFEVLFSRTVGVVNDRKYKNITKASQQRLRYLVLHSRTTRVHCTFEFSELPMLSIWNEQL